MKFSDEKASYEYFLLFCLNTKLAYLGFGLLVRRLHLWDYEKV